MVGGVGSAPLIIASLASFVMEDRPQRIMGVRRTMPSIEGLGDHRIIICGYGRFGRRVVREIGADSSDFAVGESDPQRVTEAREKGCAVVDGGATDEEVLRQAGLCRCADVATTISDDVENVSLGPTARSLRPEVAVVCRSSSTRVRPRFERAGIHRISSTEGIGARRLVPSLTRPHIVEFLDEILSQERGTLSLHAIRLEPGSALAGQRLEGSRLRVLVESPARAPHVADQERG